MLHLILKAPAWLIQNGYEEQSGFTLMQRLIAEGDKLALQLGVPDTWNTNPSAMPLLAAYIGARTLNDVWEVFVRAEDRVRLQPEPHGVPTGGLVAEFAAAGMKVERTNKDVWVPHVQVVQLLSCYFGASPTLGTIRGGELVRDTPMLLDQADLL